MVETLGAGWVRFVFDQSVDLPVYLVGDFNGWNETSHLMEHQDNGTYQALIQLQPGDYEFKYKYGSAWFNDSCAHKYVPNCWGSENSVVVVPGFEPETAAEPEAGITAKDEVRSDTHAERFAESGA